MLKKIIAYLQETKHLSTFVMILTVLTLIRFATVCLAAEASVLSSERTEVTITIPSSPTVIDPMIYGQMLEDCSDRVIYDGAVGPQGQCRPAVDQLLKELRMPIVRWPGGTFVREYQWERGIGPKEKRPVVPVFCWGGIENHQFGTDEFLAWCKRVETVPYINLNTNTNTDPEIGGSLESALNWIEYVNGPISSPFGKKRAENGHPQPYHVLYWCIGNEDYGKYGRGVVLTAEKYAQLLDTWATAIRKKYPDLQLLGVGHDAQWNKVILSKCGDKIDWLTQHYYVTARITDGKIESPESTTFAPVRTEAHLRMLANIVEESNRKFHREDRPVRLSIDEWNNRHLVSENGKKRRFTRHDDRRLFDAVVIAGTLNAFIRLSPTVGMGNSIFPVNGHGAIRTVGDHDAYKTVIYPVFQLYREKMIGRKLNAAVQGPGVNGAKLKLFLDGDANGYKLEERQIPYIDSAAVLQDTDHLNLVMINRSATRSETVTLNLPAGFKPIRFHLLGQKGASDVDINLSNTKTNRTTLAMTEGMVKENRTEFRLSPCGFLMIECEKNAK